MSSSIRDSYDYDLIKKCINCGFIRLKIDWFS